MFNDTAFHLIHVRCISWTYLHKQQMSELPSMTVFQVFTARTMLWTVLRSLAGRLL